MVVPRNNDDDDDDKRFLELFNVGGTDLSIFSFVQHVTNLHMVRNYYLHSTHEETETGKSQLCFVTARVICPKLHRL